MRGAPTEGERETERDGGERGVEKWREGEREGCVRFEQAATAKAEDEAWRPAQERQLEAAALAQKLAAQAQPSQVAACWWCVRVWSLRCACVRAC